MAGIEFDRQAFVQAEHARRNSIMPILGLIAGAIAKAIMPGNDPGGIIVTMIIGIVGAFIGGFLGNTIMGLGINGFTWQSLLLAIVGSLVLLWIYRMTTRGRTRVP